MRRADRLFLIVQYLRSRRLTTAAWLAERLEVSVRTVYRDIQDLSLSGVPVEGEAGVGYRLRHKLDLPPLQFDRAELAAINLGLRFVLGRTPTPVARAASTALAKIRGVLPPNLLADLDQARVFVPVTGGDELFLPLDAAIRGHRKLCLDYAREDGAASRRVVRPLALFYWGKAWTLLGWCELREAFRSFRLDRIVGLEPLEEVFAEEEGRRLRDYLRQLEDAHGVRRPHIDPEAAG